MSSKLFKSKSKVGISWRCIHYFTLHEVKSSKLIYFVDHLFFKSYLLKCDNNVSKCLLKIDSFFAFKKNFPEYSLSDDVQHPEFRRFCKAVYSCHLPELNIDGCCIFIDRITLDESLFDIFKIMKYYCMQMEIRLLENETDSGDIILFDCNQINLLHFIAFVPHFMKSLQIILTVYPLRLRLLVITNVGNVAETIINGIKLFAPQRYRKSVFVYSEGSEHFSKHVSLSVLPKEYGGKTYTMNEMREKWFQKLQQRRSWFKRANNEIITLRKLRNSDITFGKNGTFKTLQLD